MSIADNFERGLVLRVGRAVPLSLAAIACLVLGGAVAVLIYTALPARGAREPAAAAIPADVVVAAGDIRRLLEPGDSGRTSAAGAAQPEAAAAPAGPSAEAQAVAQAVHRIRALISESTSPWRDVYQTACRQWAYGYCYGEYQQLVARGVSSDLTAVMDLYDGEDSRAETVTLIGAEARYLVNGSNHTRKVAALDEAVAILTPLAQEDRPQYLHAWTSIRTEREQARQNVIRAEHARVVRQRAEEEARVIAARVSTSAMRASAATLAAGAVALLWTIALALAVLAIERNTRALRAADIITNVM